MKKISKYLFVSVIAFMMMISGVNATSYQNVSGLDIAIQKKEESTIKKYSNGSGGIWNPDTAEGIDKFLGTMPNPVGVRVTVVNKDGSRIGKTVDYVGWIDLGIDGKVYYNSSSVNNYKTSIVNKKGGVYFNSVYTGSGSISGTTIASKKYGNIIDGKDPKKQIFNETKEALDSGKIPQIFIDTAFCKQSEGFDNCKNKIIGENSFKYYILIEPIVMIDLYTSVYGVRMIENYTKILGWAYRGEGHKRYYGTPTELATLLEKTDTTKIDLESQGEGYEESDVTIDCTKISDGAAQKQCIDNNNGVKISYKTVYLHKEVSKKTNTNGFSFFLNGDAGIRGTGGALLLQLDDRPWIDDMNYALNSSNKEYTVPTKSYSNISYNEMYTSTVGYAMNIIWFAAFEGDPCDITKPENFEHFQAACCDDPDYVQEYFSKHIKEGTDKKDIILYCCEDEDNSAFKDAYNKAFNNTYDEDEKKYCAKEFGNCEYVEGEDFKQECCTTPEYIKHYDRNTINTFCGSKAKQVCKPQADSGSCDTDDQASFRDCAAPLSADYMKYDEASKPWSTWNDYFFDTTTNGEYKKESSKYCQTWCQEVISTNFDTTPTLYVGEVNESGELTDLLAGTFFTWEASIDGLVECRVKVDWEKFFSDFNSAADSIKTEYEAWVKPGAKCDQQYSQFINKKCDYSKDGDSSGVNLKTSVSKQDNKPSEGYNEGQAKPGTVHTATCYRCRNSRWSNSCCSTETQEKDPKKECLCCDSYSYTCYEATFYRNSKESDDCNNYQKHCGRSSLTFPYLKETLIPDQQQIYEQLARCFDVPSSSFNEANISYTYELNGNSYDVTLEKGETTTNTYIGHWVERGTGRVFAEKYGYYTRVNKGSNAYTGEAEKSYTGLDNQRNLKWHDVIFDNCENLQREGFADAYAQCEKEASNGWGFYEEIALYEAYSTSYKLPSDYNTEITPDGLHISGTDNGDSSGSVYIDFSNLKVPISTVTGTYDFNINYSGFGEQFSKLMNNDGSGQYVCKLDIKNEFLVDNEDPDEPCEGEECELDLSTGDINVIYRPIDLDDPFPGLDGTGRTTGANWCHLQLGDKIINSDEYKNCDYLLRNYSNWYWAKYDCSNTNQIVQDFILNNRGVDGKKLYSERDPLYTIRLTPSIIKEIRKEYRTFDYTSRDDYIYEVDGDGTGGYLSMFINKYHQRMVDNERVIECLSSDEIFGDPDHHNGYWNSCFTGGVFK